MANLDRLQADSLLAVLSKDLRSHWMRTPQRRGYRRKRFWRWLQGGSAQGFGFGISDDNSSGAGSFGIISPNVGVHLETVCRKSLRS